MNDSIFIRPASIEDVPQILDFIQQLAEYEKLTHVVVATEELLRETLFGPRPAAEVLLAFLAEEEMPVGFALFFTNYSTFLARPGLYLEDLFVAPQYRGRGAGKALLKALARLAKERGYGRFEWSCLDWNEPSICFYQKMGAVPLDDWTIFRVTGQALDKLAQS
jgi:GNAT superfamily N-acetyltransferase